MQMGMIDGVNTGSSIGKPKYMEHQNKPKNIKNNPKILLKHSKNISFGISVLIQCLIDEINVK